jgi:hypothetical protein
MNNKVEETLIHTGIITFLVTLTCILFYFGGRLEIKREPLKTEQISCTIIDKKCSDNQCMFYDIFVKYNYNNIEKTTKITTVPNSSHNQYNIGNLIPAWISPSNPDKLYLNSNKPQYKKVAQGFLFFSASVFLLITMVVFNFILDYTMRRNRYSPKPKTNFILIVPLLVGLAFAVFATVYTSNRSYSMANKAYSRISLALIILLPILPFFIIISSIEVIGKYK